MPRVVTNVMTQALSAGFGYGRGVPIRFDKVYLSVSINAVRLLSVATHKRERVTGGSPGTVPPLSNTDSGSNRPSQSWACEPASQPASQPASSRADQGVRPACLTETPAPPRSEKVHGGDPAAIPAPPSQWHPWRPWAKILPGNFSRPRGSPNSTLPSGPEKTTSPNSTLP